MNSHEMGNWLLSKTNNPNRTVRNELRTLRGVMSFYDELKRRNVFRVGIAYTVASWLLIQVTDIVFPRIGLPDSAVMLVIALLGVGFILAEVVKGCFCGAPFDLEATPNFNQRIEEAGFNWPPVSPITYPAKNW